MFSFSEAETRVFFIYFCSLSPTVRGCHLYVYYLFMDLFICMLHFSPLLILCLASSPCARDHLCPQIWGTPGSYVMFIFMYILARRPPLRSYVIPSSVPTRLSFPSHPLILHPYVRLRPQRWLPTEWEQGSGPKGPMSCRIQGWISIRPERAYLRPERAYYRPEKANKRFRWANLRPERADC